MARNTDSFKACHKKVAGWKKGTPSAVPPRAQVKPMPVLPKETNGTRLVRNVQVNARIAEIQGSTAKQITDLREFARRHTREALETLVSVMGDERAPAAARVAAANGILDRGHGKPTHHIETNVNVYDSLSLAEKEELLGILESLGGDATDADDGPAPTHH